MKSGGYWIAAVAVDDFETEANRNNRRLERVAMASSSRRDIKNV
jgi:hypothetical protein